MPPPRPHKMSFEVGFVIFLSFLDDMAMCCYVYRILKGCFFQSRGNNIMEHLTDVLGAASVDGDF